MEIFKKNPLDEFPYKVWKVTIKEKAMQHPIESELHGPYHREDVIKHYGLDEPDVEWYRIDEISDKQNES